MTCIPEPVDIVRHSRHKIDITLMVTEDLPFFAGHFPGQPVLPGVIMLDWVICLAQQHLGINIAFDNLQAIKFKQVVRPPQAIQLHLEYRPDTGKLLYRIDSAIAEHSSGKISTASA